MATLLILAGAAGLGSAMLKPAVAAHLATSAATRADLERALAWDPRDPDLHFRLGLAAPAFPGKADFEAARRQLAAALLDRPTHPGTWFQLALLTDRAGEAPGARRALEMALRLDPHNVSLRWEAAVLTLRWGQRDEAIEHLRYVFAVDPGQREAAFQLARALLPSGTSIATLLPDEVEPLNGLLATALRHEDLALARAAWERRAALAPPVSDGLQRQYLELLLRDREGAAARRLWLVLHKDGRANATENAVWNGGFEADRLTGWGLDWQIRRVWGLEVTLDRRVAAGGKQSLRLTFNSFPTLDYAGVSQLVPVEPGREYRLRALVKALDFTTRSGLKLQVVRPDHDEPVLAETPPVAGTTAEWLPLETHVKIPGDVDLIRVRLRREKALAPEGNLGGKVWVDEVSLVAAEGRGA